MATGRKRLASSTRRRRRPAARPGRHGRHGRHGQQTVRDSRRGVRGARPAGRDRHRARRVRSDRPARGCRPGRAGGTCPVHVRARHRLPRPGRRWTVPRRRVELVHRALERRGTRLRDRDGLRDGRCRRRWHREPLGRPRLLPVAPVRHAPGLHGDRDAAPHTAGATARGRPGDGPHPQDRPDPAADPHRRGRVPPRRRRQGLRRAQRIVPERFRRHRTSIRCGPPCGRSAWFSHPVWFWG